MSNTHFEVNKKTVYSIISFLVMCLITVLCFVGKDHVKQNDDADKGLSEAIKINQEAIQTSTKRIQSNDIGIKVFTERQVGHEKNTSAHTN